MLEELQYVFGQKKDTDRKETKNCNIIKSKTFESNDDLKRTRDGGSYKATTDTTEESEELESYNGGDRSFKSDNIDKSANNNESAIHKMFDRSGLYKNLNLVPAGYLKSNNMSKFKK